MRERISRLLDWRTTLGELVIVIVGVIIALGVDSWWDDRQDRRAELEHLDALRVEFQENLDLLRRVTAGVDTLQASTLALIEIVEGEVPTPTADSLVFLIWHSFSFRPYDPVLTAYDNLLTSGGIQLIGDEDLKRELAEFRAEVEGLGRLDWVLDQWNRIIQPWAVLNLQLDWLSPAYRAEHDVPEPRTRTDWGAVLASQEFKGIVMNRLLAFTDYEEGLEGILPAAEAVSARLGSAAAGR